MSYHIMNMRGVVEQTIVERIEDGDKEKRRKRRPRRPKHNTFESGIFLISLFHLIVKKGVWFGGFNPIFRYLYRTANSGILYCFSFFFTFWENSNLHLLL